MTNYDILFDPKINLQIQQNELIDIKNYFIKKQGWIYIAKNKVYPQLKIGRTSHNPWVRAKTLSTSGVIDEYEILFSIQTFNQFILEKKIHNKLKKKRFKKEFFNISLEDAVSEINSHIIEEKIALRRYFRLELIEQDINLIDSSII